MSCIINNQPIQWVAVKDSQGFSIVIVVNQKKYFIQLIPSIKDKHCYRQFLQGKSLQPLSEKRIQNIVKKLSYIADQNLVASKNYQCDQWGNLSFDDE